MSVNLVGKLRKQTGKKASKETRKNGMLPAVLYGQKDSLSIVVNPKELIKILKQKGRNALISLQLEEDSSPDRKVLLKDYQSHPLKTDWVHADFLEVDMKQPLKVRVSLNLVGIALGVKKGGILNHVIQELDLECLPENIPSSIDVNVEELDLEGAIHVSDLQIPQQVVVLNPPTATVATVHVEKKVEEEPAEGEEVATTGEEGEAKPSADEEGEEKKTEKK